MRIITSLLFLFALDSNAYAQTDINALEKAYRKKSVEELETFFNTWHQKSISPSKIEMNDTAQHTLALYTLLYNYIQYNIDSASKKMDSSKYIVIPHTMNTYIRDGKIFYTDAEIDSVIILAVNRMTSDSATRSKYLRRYDGKFSQMLRDNFTPDDPRVTDPGMILIDTLPRFANQLKLSKPILYISRYYDLILNIYLKQGVDNQYGSERPNYRRSNFLKPYIDAGYNYQYPIIRSYPEVQCVIYNKELNEARIDFIYRKTYTAHFVKVNNVWQISVYYATNIAY